jgi:hypothetical protein
LPASKSASVSRPLQAGCRRKAVTLPNGIPLVLYAAEQMRDMLAKSSGGKSPFKPSEREIRLTFIDVKLAPDPITGTVQIAFSPRSLMNALFLQIGQVLSGDATIKRCRHCGTVFTAGPGTPRRLDAEFCTDQHRIDFNSRKRSRRK